MKKQIVISVAALLALGGSVSAAVNGGSRTAALPSSAWEGSQWISAADAPIVKGRVEGANGRAADGASWFTSSVRNAKKVKKAVWMTSGLGVYYLYVNGKPVGEEVLKPGFTHREKTKRSFTYDVTDLINSASGAENALAAQVTPGWWADKIVTPWGHEGMLGQKPAFRGVLELTFDDGTTQRFSTNASDWKAGVAGPVTHASIFDGEAYDARRVPGYHPSVTLGEAEVSNEFKGEILPSAGAEVYHRHDLTLTPKKAYVWKGMTGGRDYIFGKVNVLRNYKPGEEIVLNPGETLVVDFGQNAAAVPQFTFAAERGTHVTVLPGELLNDGEGACSRGMDGPEGSVHRNNLRYNQHGMRLDYTFGTNPGFVSYHPDCTFYGYRFISVTADDTVRFKAIESVPVTSITKELETGTITTGNKLVNQLISNTIWGQRSNYLSVTTDCPQRDERLGWTADTQVFTETGSFFADTRDFFHKWMRDMRDSQHELGGFPGVAPLAQYGGECARVGWSDAGVIVPWVVWKQFADTAIINENWAAMEKKMNHIAETKYNHQALVSENGNYQWADWLSYEPLESCGGGIYMKNAEGHDVIRPEAYDYWNYLSACYWLIDSEMMRDMAQATKRKAEAKRYAAMADEARAYIKANFLTPEGEFTNTILNTMQTPALFALKTNLVSGPQRERMIERLRANFVEHGNCLQTGFLGTSILMPTLTENGMTDVAYELLFQRKNPSWLYSVDNGATTIWERWNSYMLDKGMGPQGMNSFNHYAYGCVCEWIWKTAAGIASDTARPGFRNIIMKPVPDKRLGHLTAEYRSPAGLIKSAWKYEGDNWIWDFTVPAGATASVTLPGETKAKTYRAGTHHVVKAMK